MTHGDLIEGVYASISSSRARKLTSGLTKASGGAGKSSADITGAAGGPLGCLRMSGLRERRGLTGGFGGENGGLSSAGGGGNFAIGGAVGGAIGGGPEGGGPEGGGDETVTAGGGAACGVPEPVGGGGMKIIGREKL